MRNQLSPAALAGLPTGVLLYVTAFLPDVYAWPLLWPVAGGALAAVLAARRGEHGRELATGARAGAIAGAVFLVFALPTALLLAHGWFAGVERVLSGGNPFIITTTMLAGMIVAAAAAVPLAMLGALLARRIARRRATA